MKNKLTLANIIVCAVLLVMAVLTIVGVCVDYISLSVTLLGSTATDGYALGNDMLVNADDGYGVMAAFAYITLALSVLVLLIYIVHKIFFNVKMLKFAALSVAALLAVCAIAELIAVFAFGGGESGVLASYSVAPAAGAWLVSLGGFIGGIAGIAGVYEF